MLPEEKDLVRLKHIKDAVEFILQFTESKTEEEFYNDQMLQSAVIRQFEIIGEASSTVSEKTQKTYPRVEWRLVKVFRNFLIHEYFKVDVAEI